VCTRAKSGAAHRTHEYLHCNAIPGRLPEAKRQQDARSRFRCRNSCFCSFQAKRRACKLRCQEFRNFAIPTVLVVNPGLSGVGTGL